MNGAGSHQQCLCCRWLVRFVMCHGNCEVYSGRQSGILNEFSTHFFIIIAYRSLEDKFDALNLSATNDIKCYMVGVTCSRYLY